MIFHTSLCHSLKTKQICNSGNVTFTSTIRSLLYITEKLYSVHLVTSCIPILIILSFVNITVEKENTIAYYQQDRATLSRLTWHSKYKFIVHDTKQSRFKNSDDSYIILPLYHIFLRDKQADNERTNKRQVIRAVIITSPSSMEGYGLIKNTKKIDRSISIIHCNFFVNLWLSLLKV